MLESGEYAVPRQQQVLLEFLLLVSGMDKKANRFEEQVTLIDVHLPEILVFSLEHMAQTGQGAGPGDYPLLHCLRRLFLVHDEIILGWDSE